MTLKHEALIRAALDGKTIQYKSLLIGPSNQWNTFDDKRLAISHMSAEYSSFEYREKPPEPVVKYTYAYAKKEIGWDSLENCKKGTQAYRASDGSDVVFIKSTFDHKGKRISSEIVE